MNKKKDGEFYEGMKNEKILKKKCNTHLVLIVYVLVKVIG
jgi:hypothetical protein